MIPEWLWRFSPTVRRLLRPCAPAIREVVRFLIGPDPRIYDLALDRDAEHKARRRAERRVEVLEREVEAGDGYALASQQRQIKRLKAEIRGLQGELRGRGADVRQAYEPVQVGTCRKVRYLHREDAQRHAAHVASRFPGESFNVYECRLCPKYVGPWHQRPLHVGHSLDESAEGVTWVDEAGLLHQPGMPPGRPVANPAREIDREIDESSS